MIEFDKTDTRNLALLVIDLQNDFLHPDGAYSNAGIKAEHVSAVAPRVSKVAEAVRNAGGLVIGTAFTLVPDRNGDPLIADHLKKLRPFIKKGDFASGSWGQGMLDELGKFDAVVEKIAYSAFYQTRLEWLIRRFGVTQFVVAGIVTQGGVASTVRDLAVRDYPIMLLEDGCASFEVENHRAAIKSLSAVASITSCEEMSAAISGNIGKRA